VSQQLPGIDDELLQEAVLRRPESHLAAPDVDQPAIKVNAEILVNRDHRHLVLVLLAVPCGAEEPQGKIVTVTGMIRASEMSRGEPRRVYLDIEEEPILLSRQGKGKELLKLVGATAEVTGHLRKVHNDENFTKVIFITDYQVKEAPAAKPPKAREKPSD